MIIAFAIWSIIALLFVGIGIATRNSKEAMGFFTFVEPPKVSDIKKYNHAVSILWMVSAILFEIMGIPFLFLQQNSPGFMIVMFGVVALVIGMMITYIKIEEKYKE